MSTDFMPPPRSVKGQLTLLPEIALPTEPAELPASPAPNQVEVPEPPPAPKTSVPGPARRALPEKRRLSRVERFRLWIGRPLLATVAFASLGAVGLPTIGAAYTRESANPMDWRNLSVGEVQAKADYCLVKSRLPGSLVWCDYGHTIGAAGLAPRAGRVRKTIVEVPYAVAGPVIYDQVAAAAPPVTRRGGGAGQGDEDGVPTARGAGPVSYPLIQFPAGPLSAIQSTCQAALRAAANQPEPYKQNVERQCEAALQAYERSHPGAGD